MAFLAICNETAQRFPTRREFEHFAIPEVDNIDIAAAIDHESLRIRHPFQHRENAETFAFWRVFPDAIAPRRVAERITNIEVSRRIKRDLGGSL